MPRTPEGYRPSSQSLAQRRAIQAAYHSLAPEEREKIGKISQKLIRFVRQQHEKNTGFPVKGFGSTLAREVLGAIGMRLVEEEG